MILALKHPSISRYGLAIAAVLGMSAVRWALAPELGERAGFLPFALVVLGVVLWLGRGPAIAASLLSFFFGLYFSGLRDFSMETFVGGAIFALELAAIIVLGEMSTGAVGRAKDSDAKAEQRAKEALEIAEKLNLLIDGAHGHAIYMLDPGGRVTIWNKGAERLKGWTEEEVFGKHISLFYPADSLAAGKPEADLERARTEGRFEEEDWRLRKDGREFLASISITPLIDDNGEVRGFAKVISDITDRRAAEEAIRARESHLRSILSTVPDAMVVFDEAGLIQSFSAAAESMFGYNEDEVVGHKTSMLIPLADQERYAGYIRRYRAGGEKRVIDNGMIVVGQRKDGTTFPMELTIGEAEGGGQHIFTGFVRDLTERQQAEKRLADLQSELIHITRVSAMDSMASTLAHELNQPIGAIANYVEAVRDRLADPSPEDLPILREALQDAADNALRAGQIVRRLRDFVARGEVERTIEPLPALIDDAAVLGLIGAREKGVETSFDLDPEASPVCVDRVQIQQVLINLIRNACDAMASSPLRQLSVTSAPDRPGFVRVTVADTGSGIAPGLKDKLFTAFVTTKRDGVGLGLSICRTIIEANEGRIWAEDREGGGTSFHFTLPRANTEHQDGE